MREKVKPRDKGKSARKRQRVTETGESETRRKQSGEALLKSEQKYRTLIKPSRAVIFSKDRDGYYHNPNLNAALGMGVTRIKDFKGKTDYDFLPKEQADAIREIDKQVMETGKLKEVEEVVRGPQGKNRIYRSYKWPKYDDKGRITGINCFTNDITELKLVKEKQQTIVKTALDGFWIVNSEGRFLEVNDSYCKMIGYTREELLKMYILDVEAIEGPEEILERMNKVTDQSHDRFETQHKRKDGRIIDVEVNVNRLNTEEGQVCAFLHDITGRKQAEEEIQKLGSAVTQSIDGIAMGDLEPKLTYVNKAFAEMHGYSPEEMIGMKGINLHSEEQMEEYDRRMNQIKTQGSWKGEIGHIRQDGTTFPTYMTVTVLKDDSGKPTGILAVARDITERKRQESEIEHLNQLLHAIFNVSEFISKETDPDKLIKGVCDAIIKARDYHYVWVTLLDKSASLIAAAEAGLGEDFLPIVEEWKLGRLPACAEIALRQPGVVVTRDMASTCTACPLADKYSSGNTLSVRLEHEGRVYGLLSIYTTSLYAEDEEELSLLLRIARDIGFALYSVELEKQRRRAVDALVELTNLL